MDMEFEDLLHMGPETLVMNLLILSLSPEGRHEVQKLLTDDPYDIDIGINPEAKNRSVEILNAYLKALGLELVFEKKEKKYRCMIGTLNRPMIGFVNSDEEEKRCKEVNKKYEEEGIVRSAIGIIPKEKSSNG